MDQVLKVKISFLETERLDEEFFLTALAGEHELTFAADMEEVPPDVEILSVFIHSKVTPEFLEAHPGL